VPSDVHVVLFAKADEGIGLVETEYAFAWLQIHAFHAVFGNDGVEVTGDNLMGHAVATSYLP
jgi:hypothetical protein